VLFGGIIHSVVGAPSRIPRLLFGAVAILACTYGIGSQVVHVMDNAKRPLGNRGFRHWIANPEALDYIHRVDMPTVDRRATLIYVTSPEIGLEVRYSRMMANHADFQSADYLRQVRLEGRVPHLHVIVQKRLVDNGKADIMLKSFTDYRADRWQRIPLGDFVAFAAMD
jgi:hypothetical protein